MLAFCGSQPHAFTLAGACVAKKGGLFCLVQFADSTSSCTSSAVVAFVFARVRVFQWDFQATVACVVLQLRVLNNLVLPSHMI